MDTFIEYLVKKKRTSADFLAMIGIAVIASILIFVLFLLMQVFASFGSIVFLLMVGVGYGAYILITSFNTEFEYVLVNNEIDVDKIINQRKRKRLTTINVKSIEEFGVFKNSRVASRHIENGSVKKIYACTDKNDDGVYYALYSERESKMLILFNPHQKMVDEIIKKNPLKKQNFEIQ